VVPLTADEADAVYPLTIARVAVAAVSGSQQAMLDPHNGYVSRSLGVTWRTLGRLLEIPPAVARTACRHACGYDVDQRLAAAHAGYYAAIGAATPVVELRGRALRRLDLSAGGETFSPGGWTSSHAIARVVEPRAASIAVGRYNERRLTPPVTGRGEPLPEGAELAPLRREAPASVHLGIDVFAAPGEPVRAPLPAVVERQERDEVTLRCPGSTSSDFWIRVAGVVPAVAAGARVKQGAPIGTIAADQRWRPAHVHVQVGLERLDRLPGRVPSAHAEAWRLVCPDPSPLAGAGEDLRAPDPDPIALRGARERTVARAQRLYYLRPPEIVRGWRAYLYDAEGRPYLDMVNNVASVGHSHPRIAAAADRALRRLNTNSRFLYDGMERLATRLTDLLPPSLSTVFFVNSGSEANDLALRLARGYTGRGGVIAIEGAYHGWTAATAAISTTPFDTPHVAVAPDVRIVPAPNPYRGRYREHDPAAAVNYAAHVREQSDGAAAFICEPQLGNAGGVLPPEGYLAAAYEHVRAAGGICVADEVQVGYARSGHTFWAFAGQQVTPDIVTVAKPAGNGYPLGMVVTNAEIADALRPRTSFFSSTGGSPLSCEVGLAVLDVIRDEGLQANALAIGERLSTGLQELRRRHELIGAAHGAGLYQGVELVRDRGSLEPARAEAYAICERMRELGVIVQPTGDHENVLKVKPPLCLTADDADFFVETLDSALANGW
jgi:4-aminobutyrate aminotransferase-like enzyme